MKHKILTCLAGLLILSFCSCKKYLDKKPDSALAVPATLADLQALLDDESLMNANRTPSFGESSADDYFLTTDRYNSFSQFNRNTYTWTDNPYYYPNDWSAAYSPVYNANYCLEQLEKITKSTTTENLWNTIKGSALFFRAFYFLQLTWTYAKAYDPATSSTDKGIVLRLGSDFNEPSSRATVTESYERIITDTKEAIAYLPEHSQNVMRPSRSAAYGLLARTYLSMREYDSAYKYADICLQSENRLLDYNTDLPISQFNAETLFYSEMTLNNFNVVPVYARIDTVLYSTYHPDDLRKEGFFQLSGDYPSFTGSYAASPIFLFSGLATDEVYLIRAETHARAARITEAMEDLNHLLMHRWRNTVPFVKLAAADKQHALALILVERRKELLMRGLRWIDIKRLNIEGASIVPKRLIEGQFLSLPVGAKRYALPLPTDIIEQTGIEQN